MALRPGEIAADLGRDSSAGRIRCQARPGDSRGVLFSQTDK
nr:hypothetical protein [Cupriavidus taiwanensis]